MAPDPVQRSTTTGASRSGHRVDRPAGQQLGLRSGHEDPRPDEQLDVAEGGAAGEVLQRLASRPPRHQRVVLLLLGGRHVVDEDEAAEGHVEDVGEQQLGVPLGRRDPGLPKDVGGRSAQRAGHCSSASSRAARSASMHDWRTGPRSPSSTWSRL